MVGLLSKPPATNMVSAKNRILGTWVANVEQKLQMNKLCSKSLGHSHNRSYPKNIKDRFN